MEIKVKYKIGQEVWVIFLNKIKQCTITGINVVVKESMEKIINYSIRPDISSHPLYEEGKLFSTKEELIKSL